MIRVITGILLLISTSAMAVEVEHLYEATVVAKNNLKLEKQAAFKQVLIRITGDQKVMDNTIVNKSFLNVTDYLVQFRYLDTGGKHKFWAQFDPEQVRKLLRQAELPEWGRHRPRALFWIAREDSKGRAIVSDSGSKSVVSSLKKQAVVRGVPAILPMLDLSDTSLVSTSDVWGRFTQPVIAASERYDADVLVFIKLYPLSSSQWLLSWDLLGRKTGGKFASLAHGEIRQSEQKAVREMIDKVANKLATIYAVNLASASSDTISLRVHGLDRIEQYVEVNQLLSEISAISKQQVSRVSDSEVTWNLTMLGGEQELMRALALDKRFEFNGLDAATKTNEKGVEKLVNENSADVQEAIAVLSPELINKYPVIHYKWVKSL